MFPQINEETRATLIAWLEMNCKSFTDAADARRLEKNDVAAFASATRASVYEQIAACLQPA